MYQQLYSRFLKARPGVLHFACHSHHYWPDVTREATLEYWEDTARLVDDKWGYFFETKVPRAQELIARNLHLAEPSRIVFAPNTHEFVFRLLSCFDPSLPLQIVTTDSEFYSFDRQIQRMAEQTSVRVSKVPVEPFATFHERFENEIRRVKPDLVFFSQVFFNSGYVVDAARISKVAGDLARMTVVDAYHGFMAMPTDLSAFHEKTYYLAGSYKYAQGGEGACFLVVPANNTERPLYTGWFAEISELEKYSGGVGYPRSALRFAGSTMDLTAIYRLIAVLELFEKENLTVEKIHAHIQSQQKIFLEEIRAMAHPFLNERNLLLPDPQRHGHFYTFDLPSIEETDRLQRELKKKGVLTDSRKNRLRFGFGLYHQGAYGLAEKGLGEI